MHYKEILATVIDMLRTIVSADHAKVDITDATNIVEELGIHSIQFVDLVVEIEDAFKIQIKNSEFSKLVRVADLVDLVMSRVPEYKAS
jgi:acyl carrier protein